MEGAEEAEGQVFWYTVTVLTQIPANNVLQLYIEKTASDYSGGSSSKSSNTAM